MDFSFGSILQTGQEVASQLQNESTATNAAVLGPEGRVRQFLLNPNRNPSAYVMADLHQALVNPAQVKRVIRAAKSGAALGKNVPNARSMSVGQLLRDAQFDCPCQPPPKPRPPAKSTPANPKGPVIKKIDSVSRHVQKTLSESKAGIESISSGAEQGLNDTAKAIDDTVQGVEDGFGHFGGMFSAIGSGLRSLGLGGLVDDAQPLAHDVKEKVQEAGAAVDAASNLVEGGLHEAADKIDDVAEVIEDKIDAAAQQTKKVVKEIKQLTPVQIADEFGKIVVRHMDEKPAPKKSTRQKPAPTSPQSGQKAPPPKTHSPKQHKPTHRHYRGKPQARKHAQRPPHCPRGARHQQHTTPYGKLVHIAKELRGAVSTGLLNRHEAKRILSEQVRRLIPLPTLRPLVTNTLSRNYLQQARHLAQTRHSQAA